MTLWKVVDSEAAHMYTTCMEAEALMVHLGEVTKAWTPPHPSLQGRFPESQYRYYAVVMGCISTVTPPIVSDVKP